MPQIQNFGRLLKQKKGCYVCGQCLGLGLSLRLLSGVGGMARVSLIFESTAKGSRFRVNVSPEGWAASLWQGFCGSYQLEHGILL